MKPFLVNQSPQKLMKIQKMYAFWSEQILMMSMINDRGYQPEFKKIFYNFLGSLFLNEIWD